MVQAQGSKCEKLEATGLVSSIAFSWVDQALSLMRAQMEHCCAELSDSVRAGMKRAAALALKVPSFGQEGSFRAVLSKLSTRMAEEGKALKKLALELSATATELPEALSQRATILQQAKRSENLASLLTTHVTLYACVTLLRSPSIGTKGEPGKKAAASLQSPMYTLLSQDLRATPPSNLLPGEAFEALWEEAATAAAWAMKCHIYYFHSDSFCRRRSVK